MSVDLAVYILGSVMIGSACGLFCWRLCKPYDRKSLDTVMSLMFSTITGLACGWIWPLALFMAPIVYVLYRVATDRHTEIKQEASNAPD